MILDKILDQLSLLHNEIEVIEQYVRLLRSMNPMESEGDSMGCPKCGGNLVAASGRMQCVKCPYGYALPIKLASYNELLEENKQLEQRIKELLASQGHQQ